MKILSISDIVVPDLSDRIHVDQFKGVELVLSCGDLPPEYLTFIRENLDAPCFTCGATTTFATRIRPRWVV
jgi:predicted phosphodiesterase